MWLTRLLQYNAEYGKDDAAEHYADEAYYQLSGNQSLGYGLVAVHTHEYSAAGAERMAQARRLAQ